MGDAVVRVRVSVRSAWQLFNGCDPDFIHDVCHAKCCDAPTRPGGALVTIHRSERAAVEARGGVVDDAGLLVCTNGCTFKTPDYLCRLHGTHAKPFGCIASPFTLNHRDTLIIRNRYRRLPCFKTDGARPAFEVFRASLDILFGMDEAARVVGILKRNRPDGDALFVERFVADMPAMAYRIVKETNDAKREATHAQG